MQLTPSEMQEIIQGVIQGLAQHGVSTNGIVASSGEGGVFDKVEDAIDAAAVAQQNYQQNYRLEDREKIIQSIRNMCLPEAQNLARMAVEETRLGRYEDKILKNQLVIERTPGPECLAPKAYSGDAGLTLEEPAPFGVIGAVTPTTNPTETIINNCISMLSAGNAVVFNVHPSAKKCCAYTVQLINKAVVAAGGPVNLATMVKEPTMETVNIISSNPKVRLMVGTGGMGMVNALLRSGKKVIGAGAGNPPVVVDETADIELAAEKIVFGASFDNNLLCLAEKEVFVLESVAVKLIENMQKQGAYLLSEAELEQVTDYCMTKDGSGWHTKKQAVGQNAGDILAAAGIAGQKDCRLAIAITTKDHPFVQVEQLMPILPIVPCRTLDDAIEWAKEAEHGNRHTASMFSQNIRNLTRFAREIETTIFVKNACTLAGVGFGGEGFTTMTIAGPTGEGITCARSFVRQRRCVLGDGGFRII